MGDDHATLRPGKIDAHAARGVVRGIQAHVDRIRRQLARRRIGRFARRHGHDLLAQDHETVIDNPHHHDEENGQDEGELDKSLALASPARGP